MAQHSIFIGYRRVDTGGDAGRIFDRLEGKFGQGRVFKDVDSIPRGVKFRDYVPTIIVQCSVFLALIGPDWVNAQDEHGRRRLDDEDDLVRIEIETALRTPGVQVIPVLVAGAAMPKHADLPQSLHPIADINAAQMRRDPDFNVDIGRLIRDLEMGAQTGKVVVDAPSPAGHRIAWQKISNSLDLQTYVDFERYYPGSEHLIDAARHRRQIEAWEKADKSDRATLHRFDQVDYFQAIRDAATPLLKAAMAREVAEAEAARKAEEERLAKARRAAEAAKAGRPLLERAFPIELPGVSDWPNPQMIAIPPGRFMMGAPATEQSSDDDERPQHEVRIDYAFALGQHTVTVDAFKVFVAETNHDTGKSAYVWNGKEWKDTPGKGWRDPGFAQTGAHPVCCVNWQDAHAFLAWLNKKAGLAGRPDAYRLPSEAEWEYACRAGTNTPFSFGDTISTAQANYDGNHTYGAGKKGEYRQKTLPLGFFPANPFGLCDMHGNVWEWCEDCWNGSYNGAPSDGSAWTTGDCSRRVLRGGSWNDYPLDLRSANRNWYNPTSRDNSGGFRLARTVFLTP